jgi:hypothetical protein
VCLPTLLLGLSLGCWYAAHLDVFPTRHWLGPSCAPVAVSSGLCCAVSQVCDCVLLLMFYVNESRKRKQDTQLELLLAQNLLSAYGTGGEK